MLAHLAERNVAVRLLPDAAQRLRQPELAVPLDALAATDLVVVLGGDGSVLATARATAAHQTPILAVHVGGFGFLNEVAAGNMLSALEALCAGDYRLEARMMLTAAVTRGGRVVDSSVGLNDAVIAKGAFSRLLNLRTFVNDQFVAIFPADGLVVATPTGSTAYSLSAGGPIVPPDEKLLLVTPICAHTMATRPLVVGGDESIRVEVDLPAGANVEVMLTVDGQVGIPLQHGDGVTVRRARLSARFVRFGKPAFYERLREKLNWGST